MKEFIDYINSLITDCEEISMLVLSNEDCSEKLSTFCSQMLNFVSQIYELYPNIQTEVKISRTGFYRSNASRRHVRAMICCTWLTL